MAQPAVETIKTKDEWRRDDLTLRDRRPSGRPIRPRIPPMVRVTPKPPEHPPGEESSESLDHRLQKRNRTQDKPLLTVIAPARIPPSPPLELKVQCPRRFSLRWFRSRGVRKPLRQPPTSGMIPADPECLPRRVLQPSSAELAGAADPMVDTRTTLTGRRRSCPPGRRHTPPGSPSPSRAPLARRPPRSSRTTIRL